MQVLRVSVQYGGVAGFSGADSGILAALGLREVWESKPSIGVGVFGLWDAARGSAAAAAFVAASRFDLMRSRFGRQD